MASGKGNGEIYPSSSGDNGGGDSGSNGLNLSVDKEIEETRRRLRQLEEELKQHEILPTTTTTVPHEVLLPAAAETEWDKSEVDARSIFVGNVGYTCSAEEVEQHFQDCGTVNRVTILTDHFGHPKGYAYVEFAEVEAVQNALLLDDTELHDRRLKVCPKRTNIPGMNHPRGRRPYDPYYPTYGMVPRFRRPPRYWPY